MEQVISIYLLKRKTYKQKKDDNFTIFKVDPINIYWDLKTN